MCMECERLDGQLSEWHFKSFLPASVLVKRFFLGLLFVSICYMFDKWYSLMIAHVYLFLEWCYNFPYDIVSYDFWCPFIGWWHVLMNFFCRFHWVQSIAIYIIWRNSARAAGVCWRPPITHVNNKSSRKIVCKSNKKINFLLNIYYNVNNEKMIYNVQKIS